MPELTHALSWSLNSATLLSVQGLTRRRGLALLGGAAATGVAGLWLWPTHTSEAAYPLARRVSSADNALWRVDPEALERATRDDSARLLGLVPQVKRGAIAIEQAARELAQVRVGDLASAERSRLRSLWWQVFEPILALDELKQRYRGWYGLDYFAHRTLHARTFLLSFAALSAQVDAGLRLLAAVAGNSLLQTLFDEKMPELGLPARTFSGLRSRLGRARDVFYIPLGNEWYKLWILPALVTDKPSAQLRSSLASLSQAALTRVLMPQTTGIQNKLELLKGELFHAWFPVQKQVAEWAGDTRLTPAERRLISDAQLKELRAQLEPGDVLLERRNWYLSNIGLPGFWPHAALYVGTQQEIRQSFAKYPEIRSELTSLLQRLASHASAWKSLQQRDAAGHEHCVIEAVSEGVVSASLEHSCGADYVAALRPRLGPRERLRAIERTLRYWGRPYDFNFDFATDDQLVCSELVIKAYEPELAGDSGLEIPYIQIAGRRAVPPTEFARAFATDRVTRAESQRFDFVYFLEGREKEHTAHSASAQALANTVDRPKWDIMQP